MKWKNLFKEEFSTAIDVVGETVQEIGHWMTERTHYRIKQRVPVSLKKKTLYYSIPTIRKHVQSHLKENLHEQFGNFLYGAELNQIANKATEEVMQKIEKEVEQKIINKIENNAHSLDHES